MATAQAALNRWPDRLDGDAVHDVSDACRRLLAALGGLATSQAGWQDVAALIRQLLLTDRATYGGSPVLSVPTGAPWPTRAQWEALACDVTTLEGGRLAIRARPWEPPSTPEDCCVGAEAAREQVLAVYRDVEPDQPHLIDADPFWKAAHHYQAYRGEPQRQAARAAVLNDEGSVVVALPTGRGKTAVAWSKVLMSTQGVTIVVVPTVVLALDMERRTRQLARDRGIRLSTLDRYAYVGSLDSDVKASLRAAVRSGEQRLLYTSPEAFVSGLASAVLACAEAGRLQQVVVDEAHLVDQWGTDFRPEFQTMPGLIRDAHGSAPAGHKPSILLLSATLAQRPVDLLTRLFSVGGTSADLVWGSEMRTEPAYFIDSRDAEVSRLEAVLEAVARLPRPMILYVTKVQDAAAWVERLRTAGVGRIGSVTGQSSDEERRRVMERWRGTGGVETGYDIVVGTSAFGLGLDMPNVRTVIHACIPETIDRYYQEVGRSGRDGRPSIAYLCAGPGDRSIAERLSEVTMVGDRVGWSRWQSLLQCSEQISELRFRVRKSALPAHLDEGFGRSAQWNVRTLTLMAQAGIIELRVPLWRGDPQQTDEGAEASRQAFFDEVEDFIEFELKNGEYLSQDGWTSALARVRDEVRAAQRGALRSSMELLQADECVGRRIARHYRVSHGGGLLTTQPACRGCPACRRDLASVPPRPTEPVPGLPAPVRTVDPLESWRGAQASLFIWHDAGADVRSLLARMAQRGLRVFAGVDPVTATRLQRDAPSTPIIVDDANSAAALCHSYEGPVVFVLDEPWISEPIAERCRLGLVSYIVGPRETPDADRPDSQRRDIGAAVSASALLKGL